MIATLSGFASLYFATFLLMIGSGLINTYMALRLSAESVSEVWIGLLISGYYLGQVIGARIGHRLIIRAGHVRAYLAAGALATCVILAQTLITEVPAWVCLRLVAGVAMVVQFMATESWLHEQTENHHRGRVLSLYLVMSGVGTALGQLSITLYPTLDLRPLTFAAICQAMSLIPIALTARRHPAAQMPAPLDLKYFLQHVPAPMITVFLAGAICGSYYGLAAVFAVKMGLTTNQVATYIATGVIAGLISQWPMGWLSDRVGRAGLIRVNASLFCVIALLMWGWVAWPFWVMLLFSAALGVLQFTLYALASGLANDSIEPVRRVGMSAIVLMTYGVGACLGPIVAGGLMRLGGPGMFYVFASICALVLIVVIGKKTTTRQ
jgi:MFS family permease